MNDCMNVRIVKRKRNRQKEWYKASKPLIMVQEISGSSLAEGAA